MNFIDQMKKARQIQIEKCSRHFREIHQFGNDFLYSNKSSLKDITDEFTVELRVELERQRGIIAELAAAITRAEGNLERIAVTELTAFHPAR